MAKQAFTAELTIEQIKAAEALDRSFAPVKRMALQLMTRDQEQLQASIQADDGTGEAMLELAEALETYLERRKAEDELLSSARARLWYVLGTEAERYEQQCEALG